MIQKWIREQLEPLLSKLEWSVDFEHNVAHAGIVYEEGGGGATHLELVLRKRRYMVWIETEDWDYAKYAAHEVAERFRRDYTGYTYSVEFKDKSGTILKTVPVFIHSIVMEGEPNPLGVENGRRIYTINLNVTLTPKEETQNG